MSTLTGVVTDELRVSWQRAFATLVIVACLAVGLATCLTPTLLDGNNETIGIAGLVYGFRNGALLSCAVGPLTVFAIAQSDYDDGMRAVRHVCGTRMDLLSLAQLCTAIATVGLTAAMAAVAATVAGLADLTRRVLVGPSAETLPWTVGPLLDAAVILGGAVAATAVCWLLCLMMRSGIRAILLLTMTVATWLGLLLAVADRDLRPWLVGHPAAAPWKAVNPVDAASATLDTPAATYAASAACWGALLIVAATHQLRRP